MGGVDTRRSRLSSQVLSAAALLASMFLGACSGSTGSGGPSPGTTSQAGSDINNQLASVTCASTSHCIAVGYAGQEFSGAKTLIEETSGGVWSVVPSPNPNPSMSSELADIACPQPTQCIAVGRYLVDASLDKTLIEQNNGSGWTIVPSPNPTDFNSGYLLGVTCAGAGYCVAVGAYETSSGASQALIEESTGGGWTIVPSPNSNGGDNSLSRVACISAGRCFAVGSIGVSAALIEEKTGGAWKIVPVASAGPLSDVSCASPTYCLAVGFSGSILTGGHPLIVENAGSGWSVTSASNADGTLSGAVCPSVTNCIAVGNLPGGDTLVEQKTGNFWTLLPRLTISSSDTYGLTLNRIACASADLCLIVGAQFIGAASIGGSIGKTLIVENTGGGWASISSPNVTAGISG
jgi:hypothetical protein